MLLSVNSRVSLPAGVLQVVDGVVDADAVIFVGQVSLQLVPSVAVLLQLVVNLGGV